jgi:endonuclease YncB( thermonuclease family)
MAKLMSRQQHRRQQRPRPSGHGTWPWVLLILIAIGVQFRRDLQRDQPNHPQAATKVFEVILDARWEPHRDNDGDSFHLMHSNGKTNEFRLYFADCPEKRRHDFNGDRLLEQGRDFGGLSEAQMTQIGQQALSLTQHLLTTQPFTIYTKWQRVYNSSRHYAFVIFSDGEDLSAKLVRAGLARIHTSGTTLPNGQTTSQYQTHLRQLEAEARTAARGAWALR